MLEDLSRGSFTQADSVLKDLDCIAQQCGHLNLHHTIGEDYLDKIANAGVFQRQADIFTRLRHIAQQIHYSDAHRYRSLGDLEQLFKDSGIPPVAKLIKAQLEALVVDTEGLKERLPHLASSAIVPLALQRELIRDDSDLYASSASYLPDHSHESGYLSDYPGWTESQLADPNQSEYAHKSVERSSRLTEKSWHFDPDNSFSVSSLEDSSRLHLRSQLCGGNYKHAFVDIELSSLEDQIILEDKKERPESVEEEAGGNTKDLAIIQQLSKLGVRHIPQIYRHEAMGKGRIRLFIEHFRGRDADLRLEDDRPKGFPPHELKLITRCLLEHLCDLHKHGYLHRDIKPANILLQESRAPLKGRYISGVAITDFGFATRLKSGATQAPTLCGTRAFAAPEIFKEGKASEKADIWSAGATLFQCRYGRAFLSEDKKGVHLSPFLPTEAALLIHYYATRAFEPPGGILLLDETDRFILKLLCLDPEKRPSAAEALLEWEKIENRMSRF
jgi:hypothetical protein